jgi:ADP-ribose pyrophosphatase
MSHPVEEVFVGRRFRVVRHTQRLRDGSTAIRETVQHPGAVAVLPILPDGRVCLIRNYRIAVDQTLLELPAGTLEPGEDPAECAGRELSEETGFRAGKLEKLTEFFMSPGILNERMHLFLATELVGGAAELEAGEEIELAIVSWEEALAHVREGRIRDAKTLAGLLFFDRFGKRVGGGA